jgi:hypothetical protein
MQIDTAFKIKRPALSVTGLFAQLDPYVKKEIDLLDANLSKKCLARDGEKFWIELDISNAKKTLEEAGAYEQKASLEEILKLDIDDLIDILESASTSNDKFSFSDLIDQMGDTSLLYELEQKIDANKTSYNAAKLLSETPIRAYLFCRAAYSINLNTALAIFNYISKETDEGGIKLLYDYIIIKAAWDIKEDIKLDVSPDDCKKMVAPKLKDTNLNFTEDTFKSSVTSIMEELIYDKSKYKLIKEVKDALKININDADVPALINYIKQSKFEINTSNARYFLSIALNDIKNTGMSFSPGQTTSITDVDFSVKFYEDEKGTLVFLRENVACAAQMYYVMTLGDELEIFNVINRITTYYLPSGLVDISSKEILKDLQSYVFNDSFKDQNNVEYRRTHPEERKMFYRQLFSAGGGEIIDGMIVNNDFNTLWGKLFEEIAKYIEKVATSQNPTLYVSNQNICQAVEDLQYNLSTHCSGMIKVVSPIINKELDFVIERFLKNDELVKQLALSNSRSFWKVIERVLTDLRKEVPNVSALRSKAVLGYKLISTIADYTQGDFDDDKKLSDLISTGEAFIIANEELEKGKNIRTPNVQGISGTGNMNREEPPAGNKAAQSEWNF